MFLLMAFSVSPDSRNNWRLPRFYTFSLTMISFVFFLGIGYLSIRNFLAESFYKSSYDSLSEKNGNEVYNMQRSAVILNPHSDKYHLALSQTSLALADSFARIENPSNEEKQKVTKLAQQSIEEAQRAVSANKQNSLVWDNLSKIYGALQKFAIGSDNWAIEAARQKIMLDPANPNSYLSLGTLYFSQEKFAEAENNFREAINLKEDLLSAHFNLALSLKSQGRSQEAKKEFETTLNQLPAASPDLPRLHQELAVEDEVVRVPVPGDRLEHLPGVEPVSGMELAQVLSEGDVLEDGEEPVREVLVARHAAGEGLAPGADAGAEHHIHDPAREEAQQMLGNDRALVGLSLPVTISDAAPILGQDAQRFGARIRWRASALRNGRGQRAHDRRSIFTHLQRQPWITECRLVRALDICTG